MKIKAQEKLIAIIIGFVLLFLFTSCSAEKRIYDYSYTDSWYYSDKGERYQVYQTARGIKYILVLNKKETKIIRKYIKPLNK
jgi:hypothetical protein